MARMTQQIRYCTKAQRARMLCTASTHLVGAPVGCPVGVEGNEVGCADGTPVGMIEGCEEGSLVGCTDGCPVGNDTGWPVGCVDG